MRSFVSLIFACMFVVLASYARAQEIDLAASGSTLFSSKSNSASQAVLTPPLKGGLYPGGSAEIVFKNHFGISAEGAFRYHEGFYNGYQEFRPVLYDVNGVFVRNVNARASAHFMAGFGGETLIFYNSFANCQTGSCPTSISSTNFLLHAGFGLRYYVWRSFFARPEVHYYFVPSHDQFNSGSILRLGASVGYTFGR